MTKGVLVMMDKVESFDRLSILEVKYAHAAKDNKFFISSQIIDLEQRIVKSIGFKLYQKVKISKEYSDLFEANQNIFDGVNKARNKEISGFELNQLNDVRTNKKKALGAKFFGENEMREVKINSEGSKI